MVDSSYTVATEDTTVNLNHEEEDEDFFEHFGYFVTKDQDLKVSDYVVVTGGTRYVSSEVCRIHDIKTKMAMMKDSDGNNFSKRS